MRYTGFLYCFAAVAIAAPLCSIPPAARASETDVNAPVSQRYDLKGKVDDDSGAPLRGASVYIYTAKPRLGVGTFCPSCYADCGKIGQTGADGSFTIKSLAPDLIFRILVIKDGYTSKLVARVDPSKPLSVVKLAKTPASDAAADDDITGMILDNFGKPVVGASIEFVGVNYKTGATFGGDFKGIGALAISNEKGEFCLPCRKTVKSYSGSTITVLSIYATVQARGFANTTLLLKPKSVARNIVHMALGAKVTGQVVDTNGKPIPQAVVEVLETDRNCETFTGWNTIATDSHGVFALPCARANAQSVACVHMTSLLKSSSAAQQITFMTPGNGKSISLGVIRTVPDATITGHLILPGGGSLPQYARIMLGRDGTWDTQEVIAGPDGSYTFQGVPVGEPMSLYSNVQIGSQRYSVNKEVTVTAGQSTADYVLTLGLQR